MQSNVLSHIPILIHAHTDPGSPTTGVMSLAVSNINTRKRLHQCNHTVIPTETRVKHSHGDTYENHISYLLTQNHTWRHRGQGHAHNSNNCTGRDPRDATVALHTPGVMPAASLAAMHRSPRERPLGPSPAPLFDPGPGPRLARTPRPHSPKRAA